MTAKLTRDQQRARTRAELLDAAARVFAEHGYHATSVDMVAEAAGYTKGAIYSNFTSKEELFLALLEQVREQSLADLDHVMNAAPATERSAILGSESGEIAQWSADWFLLEAEFELYAARNPAVRERVAERQRATRDAVRSAVERHLAELSLDTPHDSDDLARLIIAVGDGLSLMALNNADTEVGRLTGTFLEILVKGATR